MNNPSQFEGVPVARLSATEIPLKRQFEVFKQTISPIFDVIPVGDTRSFSCSITSYLVDQLTFTHASFDEIQVSRHLSHRGPDCITLQYFYSGGMQTTLESGKPLQIANDVVSIQDFAHPFRSVGKANSFFSVIIPRHAMAKPLPGKIAIHEQIYQRHPIFSCPVNSPAGLVLTQAWLTLWKNLPNTSLTDAPAIAQGFVGLLNGLLSGLLPTPENMAVQAQVALATEDAMKSYLRAHLHLPNASVNMLCQVFHCSRATVYRLFKAEGGVHAYVRKQRLTRCYQALRQLPPSSRKTVSEISHQWGFTDAASFSRLFRKQYGISPSEVGADRSKTVSAVLDKNASYGCDSDRLRQWLENYCDSDSVSNGI
ncbi:MAG: helix-turn-helix transcriptional regulator [Jannaschia sp.]